MSSKRASLRDVSTGALADLRYAIAAGHLSTPISRAGLVGVGIRHQFEAIEESFAGLGPAACLRVLDAVLAERENPKPSPKLVWTGPEGPSGLARDTAVVLRRLFEGAKESVILAGYSFDHAKDVLLPLYETMRLCEMDVRFFVDIPQRERGDEETSYAQRHLGDFLRNNWPFGAPVPRIYYDKRALVPGPPYCSLHAKCVVIDGMRAFVSSANFTQRGQERNIEVGVLLEDVGFATQLAAQWMGLIEAGLVVEYR